jgi:SHS2 domain-containing protein
VTGPVGTFRFVEDVALADCAVDLQGRDLDDLFETAAVAMAELMVDPATLSPTVNRIVALEADQLDLLLYDWMSELIFLKDRDGQVFPRCQARVDGEGPFRLQARLQGGVLDPERTALGADPKAVTFHQFRLEQREGGWTARVVIDI